MKTVATLVIWFLSCLSPVQAQEIRPPFPWRFVEVASLQTEIPEAGVSTLRSAGIDGEGNVSLTSSRILAIHQFNPNGTWKRNLGTRGSGPGEFQATHLVSVAFNGELLVYDGLGGRKLTHFDGNGKYLSSIVNLFDGPAEGISIATSDAYFISSLYVPYPDAKRIMKVKLSDRAGNDLWSLNTEVEAPDLEIITERMVIRFGPNPVGQDVLWAVDPSGNTWILTSYQDRLLCIDSLGNELSSTETDIPPLILSRSDWRQFVGDKFDPFISKVEPGLREDYINLRDDLMKARGDLRSIQRMWWAGSEGLLVDRSVYQPDTVNHWALVPGRYAALLSDGSFSEEVEGPGGLFVASNGYALCLESLSDELPVLTLYRIESRR